MRNISMEYLKGYSKSLQKRLTASQTAVCLFYKTECLFIFVFANNIMRDLVNLENIEVTKVV